MQCPERLRSFVLRQRNDSAGNDMVVTNSCYLSPLWDEIPVALHIFVIVEKGATAFVCNALNLCRFLEVVKTGT